MPEIPVTCFMNYRLLEQQITLYTPWFKFLISPMWSRMLYDSPRLAH